MTCGGQSSRPPVQRLIDEGKLVPRWHWCSSSLNTQVIHQLLTKRKQMIRITSTSTLIRVDGRLFQLLFWSPMCFVFFKTSNLIFLAKSRCHSDSLTGWEERWLDVVNISWLSEWGNVTAETYDSLHYIPPSTFPGTWNSILAELFLVCHGAYPDWSSEGEAPHQPDFHNVIILVDLCIRHK